MLNLMSTVCWPPYKTGCYSNQERGTMNGCTAVIHKRIQVKNSCLDLPAMLFTPTSELKERMLKTGAQALFFVLSSAILNTYVYYRCKPVSRSPFPVPRSPFPVPRSPMLILVQNLPCLKCVFQVSLIRGPHLKLMLLLAFGFEGVTWIQNSDQCPM